MRVAWFSTGLSSFLACYYAKDVDEIIYTHISNQHPDSLRFLHDCEKILARHITVLQSIYFRSVDDVILSTGCINTPWGAPCTTKLKKDVRKDWELEHPGEHTYIWGYDYTERERAKRLIENMPQFNHEFPLIDRELTKENVHAICMNMGLKRPVMYDMGYPNNNCIGCVKGGKGYWNMIRRDFPDVFHRRAEQERQVNHSCIKGCFLDELPEDVGRCNEVFPSCDIFCQLYLD